MIARRPAVPGSIGHAHMDIETTDLDPQVDEIWQIAWTIDGPYGSFSFDAVVEHSAEAKPWTLENTQYTDMVSRGPLVTREFVIRRLVADVLSAGAEVTIPVGAYPSFDHAFISKMFARSGKRVPYDRHAICVEQSSMRTLGLPAAPGLDQCAEMLGVPRVGARHDARSDKNLSRSVFLRLSEMDREVEDARIVAESIRQAWDYLVSLKVGGGNRAAVRRAEKVYADLSVRYAHQMARALTPVYFSAEELPIAA